MDRRVVDVLQRQGLFISKPEIYWVLQCQCFNCAMLEKLQLKAD